MKISYSRKSGFTVIELLVLITMIALLVSIAVPAHSRQLVRTRTKVCVANLNRLEGAKIAWAKQSAKIVGEACVMSDIVGAGKYLREQPVCPSGGAYTLGAVGVKPTCSIPGHVIKD